MREGRVEEVVQQLRLSERMVMEGDCGAFVMARTIACSSAQWELGEGALLQ